MLFTEGMEWGGAVPNPNRPIALLRRGFRASYRFSKRYGVFRGSKSPNSADAPSSPVAWHAQGPDVGASIRSVKYPFARSCWSLGSRSVPMYSSRKSSRTWTLGVRRAEPEKSAHRVIGSGLHRGRMGARPLRTSARFAIYSGRMAMPSPLTASFRATVGSLETTRNRMLGVAIF